MAIKTKSKSGSKKHKERGSFRAVGGADADYLWGSRESSSGEVVTPDTAMRVGAVWTAVKILSETLATLPINVYEKVKLEGGKSGSKIADSHPLQKVLHTNKTNTKQTTFEFKEMQQARLALRGNAYSYIKMSQLGVIEQLIPLHPDFVEIIEQENKLIYKYYSQGTTSKGPLVFQQDEILHVKCMAIDSLKGLSPIDQMMDMVGTAMAMDRHGASTFKNSGRPSGVLKYQKSLAPAQLQLLRDSWERQYSGASNAGRTAILENGMEFVPISMSNEQAQWLDSMKMKRSEIGAMWRVPPHMMGDLDRATFSNIEHMSLEFIQFTMMPWITRWETAMNAALFTEREQEKYFVKFNEKAFLRGDGLARAQKLSIERQNGIISANEWRALEEYNPIDSESGDVYLIPLNMVDAADPTANSDQQNDSQPSRVSGGQQQEPASTDSNLNRSFVNIFEPIITAASVRIATKEFKSQEKKSDKIAWCKEFQEKSLDSVIDSVVPVLESAILSGQNRQKIDEFAVKVRENYKKSLEISAGFEDFSIENRAKIIRKQLFLDIFGVDHE